MMKCSQYESYGQMASKNARAGSMGFIWAVKEACLEGGRAPNKCDLARGAYSKVPCYFEPNSKSSI